MFAEKAGEGWVHGWGWAEVVVPGLRVARLVTGLDDSWAVHSARQGTDGALLQADAEGMAWLSMSWWWWG